MANYERDVSPENVHSCPHLPSITLAESRPLAVGIVIHLPISLLMLSAYSPYQQNLHSTFITHIFQLAFAYPLVYTAMAHPYLELGAISWKSDQVYICLYIGNLST